MDNIKNKPKNSAAQKKPFLPIALCVSTLFIAVLAFAIWYHQPRHYEGNIVFELEEGHTLDIPAEAISINNLLDRDENVPKNPNQPVTKTVSAKSEDETILDVRFELTEQKRFFQPDAFYGKLFINGKEYISTFSVENPEEEPWPYSFPKSMGSVLGATAIYAPHDTGSWIQNLKAKLQGEQWIPLFVLKDHENTKNTIIVNNLQELFKGNATKENDLTIKMGEKIYTIKNSALN